VGTTAGNPLVYVQTKAARWQSQITERFIDAAHVAFAGAAAKGAARMFALTDPSSFVADLAGSGNDHPGRHSSGRAPYGTPRLEAVDPDRRTQAGLHQRRLLMLIPDLDA
jgi:hypothetical protein